MGRNVTKGQRNVRRSSLNISLQWVICDHVERGLTMSAAARAANISPRTLQRWLQAGRKHRKGKYRRLVNAVEEARSKLLQTIDSIEYDIAVDPSLPASVRLTAVRQIRMRVFAHLQHAPQAQVDVYHHHHHDVNLTTGREGQDEQPPRSVLSSDEIAAASSEELKELREALQKVRPQLPGAPWPEDAPARKDVIDAEGAA